MVTVQTDRTSVHLLERFEEELIRYEMEVKPKSPKAEDYRQPTENLKRALVKLVNADESDTLSLMRILVDHIQVGITDTYSEHTLMMMSANTRDVQARDLIVNVAYIARCVIDGRPVNLNGPWLALVNHNMAIMSFLKNYATSDQKLAAKTPEDNTKVTKDIAKLTTSDPEVLLKIEGSEYEVYLSASEPQKVSFALSPDVAIDPSSCWFEEKVILCPQVRQLILDRSVGFSDNARIQLQALGSIPTGYHAGQDTLLILPNLFYSARLIVFSTDAGKSWTIVDFQVLPPSADRQP